MWQPYTNVCIGVMADESNTPPPPLDEDQVVLEHDPLIGEAWATFTIVLSYVDIKLPQSTILTELKAEDDEERHTATIRQPPCRVEIRVLTSDALGEDDGNDTPPGQLRMHPSDNFHGVAIPGPGLVTSRVRSLSGSYWLYFRFYFEGGLELSDLGRAFEVGMFASMVVQSVVFKSQSPVSDGFLGRWRIGPLDDWANANSFCGFDRDSAYMKYGLNIVDASRSGSNRESTGTIFETGRYGIAQCSNGKIVVLFVAKGGEESIYELNDMHGHYQDQNGFGWKKEGELGEW